MTVFLQRLPQKNKIAIFAHVMILFLLVAFIAFSVGLAFFFLVPGSVGYGIGVTMFVVAALLFVIGEANYFSKMKKIQNE